MTENLYDIFENVNKIDPFGPTQTKEMKVEVMNDKERVAQGTRNKKIRTLLDLGIPLELLTRHVMIVGRPYVGKSQLNAFPQSNIHKKEVPYAAQKPFKRR